MNQVILMGRKTFEGMNKRVLPGRISIILTRDETYQSDNEKVLIMHSPKEVLDWYHKQNKDLFITGGAEILALLNLNLNCSIEQLFMKNLKEILIFQVHLTLEDLS